MMFQNHRTRRTYRDNFARPMSLHKTVLDRCVSSIYFINVVHVLTRLHEKEFDHFTYISQFNVLVKRSMFQYSKRLCIPTRPCRTVSNTAAHVLMFE